MQPLPNFDFGSIRSVDQAIDLIDSNLSLLVDGINAADFAGQAARDQLSNNIVFLRQYYTAAERLLLAGGA